jgi:SAM-dependent methyltransferase
MKRSKTWRISGGSELSIVAAAARLIREAACVQEDELFARARAGLTFNAPLSGERADALAEALGGGRVLDLGCGRGDLLRRVVARWPEAVGVGVDLDETELAAAAGERIELHHADITEWREPADAVIAIGVAHAWGGAGPMLRALRALAPRVLVGDGFWAQPPSAADRAALGDLGTLDDLLDAVRDAGYAVEDVQVATLDEWDAFESGWRAGLVGVADELAERRRVEYEDGYRGVAGFAYVLGQASS